MAHLSPPDINALKAGLLAGNRASLSQAITLCESSLRLHQELSLNMLEELLPHGGKSIRIGVSGIPGAGKSTFIEALGMELIEKHQKKVAVLAIDPTSEQSGGSILGDKTRMDDLSRNHNAFIRPTATSTQLGGVGQYTQAAIILCEAAGFDVVIVETVGVGQSEISVNKMVDVFLLLQIVGAGDDLQGMKRGILECVDLLVINKADGELKQKAQLEAANLKKALHLFPQKHSGWSRQVKTCSSIEKKGITDIWNAIEEHQQYLKSSGKFEVQRKQQTDAWFVDLQNNCLFDFIHTQPSVQALLIKTRAEISSTNSNPLGLVREMKIALKELFFRK